MGWATITAMIMTIDSGHLFDHVDSTWNIAKAHNLLTILVILDYF